MRVKNDLLDRRLSDQYVRAWLGERLVNVRDRVPAGAVGDRLDELILHCQFGDQRIIRAIEAPHFAEPAVSARLDAQDLSMVLVAERADGVTEATIGDYVGEVEAIVKERLETILAL